MSKKIIIILAITIAAIAIGIFAFSKSKNTATNKPIDPATITEEVEITMWHGVDATQEEALQQLTDEFNAEWEGTFHVTLEQQAGSYDEIQQKIQLSESPEDLPTMALGQLNWLIEDQSKIIPLDDYINDEVVGMENFDDIKEEFIPGMTINDQIYGMPYAKSAEVLYVNETMQAELGLTTPTTWEELFANAAVAAENGTYGYLPDDLATYFTTRTMQMDEYYAANGEINIDTEAGNIALTELANCFAANACRITSPDPYGSYPFSYGDVMYLSSTTSTYPFIYPDGFEYSAAPLPGGVSPIQGQDIIIFSGHSDEEVAGAWEFTKFLMEPENLAFWCASAGYLPTTNAAIETEYYQEFAKTNEVASMYLNDELDLYSETMYANSPEVIEAIDVMIETIADNPSVDIAELLTTTQIQIEALMSR